MNPGSFTVRAVVCLALLLVAGRSASSQEPMQPVEPVEDPASLTDPEAQRLDAESADIAAKLRCPVCTGQSVLESNSGIAQEMQAVIRERLASGESEQEVLDYFVASYGDWIVLKPRATGWNALVYILPGVVVLGGGLLLVRTLRKWSQSGTATRHAGEAGDDGLAAEDEAWLRESVGRG